VDTPYNWTIDVEGDWGGRTNAYLGIKEGIPKILSTFDTFNIKALFFISTEVLNECRHDIYSIRDRGHVIGSHGHFHMRYEERWRWQKDKEISELLLTPFKSKTQETFRYRAPWFNQEEDGDPYSKRERHVSVLQQSWFGGSIPQFPIFYLHPFDVVEGLNPPSLYTRILYAHPKMVWHTFNRLAGLFPGEARLR